MPRADFNGDGRSDILWHLYGVDAVSNWLAKPDGGFTPNDANAFNWLPDWHQQFVATGDFNGDGRSDVLWRFDAGAWGPGHYYEMTLGEPGGGLTIDSNGISPGAPRLPQVSDPSWSVAGTGDFNGDGRDDLLWRHDNGILSNWLANPDGSFTNNDANAMTNLLQDRSVQGIGDFNNDGRDDLVTRDHSGAVAVSYGAAWGGFGHDAPFGHVPAEWFVAGVGDFNGSGHDDILWRNSITGAVSNWLYAGGGGISTFGINDANALVQVSNDWQIMAIGDYNGDGRDDILWRNNSSGAVSNWLSTIVGGWTPNDANALVAVPTEWFIYPDPLPAALWDY